ncbi:MAG: hypothetical protein WC695_05250 [Candidatus Omnitrophota bacterium]
MSIINDALKKVEQSREQKTDAPSGVKPKRDLTLPLVYVIVGCLGFLTAKTAYSFINAHFSKQPRQEKAVEKNISLPAFRNSAVKQAKTPPAAIAVPAAKETMKVPARPSSETPDASGFALNGVFFSGNEGFALINNHIVKEGDSIEGAVIQRITLDEVDLSINGSTVKIYTYAK